MKRISTLILLFSSVFFYLISCKKEFSCEDCQVQNHPPIANAGNELVLVFPKDSAYLDGNASRDPDGKIVDWEWSRISGPGSVKIDSPFTTKTLVKGLDTGVHEFELRVTDDGGLSDQDTIKIIVVWQNMNHPPVAKAGADTIITLPDNAYYLDGSNSYDPDNDSLSYTWRQIANGLQASIDYPSLKQTWVRNLQDGVYHFELSVTDDSGLISKDTIVITVNPPDLANCNLNNREDINVQVEELEDLDQSRISNGGTVGDKVIFAGGIRKGEPCYFECGEIDYGSSQVDLYDGNGGSHSNFQLSQERLSISVISDGENLYFAGGHSWSCNFNANSMDISYKNVDIYHAATNSWEIAYLSQARSNAAAAVIGNKVLFAGGYFYTGNPASDRFWDVSDVVDIYDRSSGGWSTYRLSRARSDMRTLIMDSKVYFIGGFDYGNDNLTEVDIYDYATNSWMVSNLNLVLASLSPPSELASIDYFDKIGDFLVFWGKNGQVGIRNLKTGETSVDCVTTSHGKVFMVQSDLVLFDGKGHMDIYDPANKSWKTGQINHTILKNINYSMAIPFGNSIYLGGGYDIRNQSGICDGFTNKVFRLNW